MKCKKAWLSVCGMALSAGAVIGQQPLPSPSGVLPYGYPGPVAPGYIPGVPSSPPPNSPYGTYVPHMPYSSLPAAARPSSQAAPKSAAPTAPQEIPGSNAGEPYLVQPEQSTNQYQDAIQAPDAKSGAAVGETFARMVQYVFQSDEPYTAYEGPRYQAQVREDCTRMWVQGSFIHWWIRRDATPPLLSTGNAASPNPGVLGNADTAVLLGGGAIGPQEFSGAQATVGWWLDPERIQFVELGGFWLGPTSQNYRFGTDGAGNPPLTTPVVVGIPGGAPAAEGGFFFARPGISTGTLNVNSAMDLHGLELNIGRNLLRLCGWSIDGLYGARYIYLNDDLTNNYNFTSLVAGFPMNGAPQPAGSNFVINDEFKATNRFYGGQIGARASWSGCRLDLGIGGKIAFGANSQVVLIDGSTTLNPGAAGVTAPGGLLAQATNSGRYSSTVFAVVPEATATIGYRFTPGIRVFAGYTFLYWNNVQRAGEQIDRQIDLGAVPTGPIIPGAAALRPAYTPNRTDFWAQGINVGLELKY